VDSCYKDAIDGIDNNEKVAFDEAAKCEDAAQNSISNNLGFIDNLISVYFHNYTFDCDRFIVFISAKF